MHRCTIDLNHNQKTYKTWAQQQPCFTKAGSQKEPKLETSAQAIDNVINQSEKRTKGKPAH